jgi:hypothetical protein
MPQEDLLTYRKPLAEICQVPDRIISVYSLEKHVWADGNDQAARAARRPELQTAEEFQIQPVRSFLNDILRGMAAPYRPERRDESIGQGYWIQAEFGSGKSHLLCFLATLAMGNPDVWGLVREKEQQANRGRRESLYRFWEEGLQAKSSAPSKGMFVVVKTLVGTGGGAVGIDNRGRRLVDYILEAASEQIKLEIGRNLSIYPAELLADRFIAQDLDRFGRDFRKFLKDPTYFTQDEIDRHDFNELVAQIQDNRSPEYKRSIGNKLWRFYTEYLGVQPQIPAETEDILKNLVETIMAEGYSGVLLVLDEVSLFMKDREEDQRVDDEKTLVVLSNRLAKVHNLPIWTVCAAQQAIESKMGVKNIIADDRLKLVELLREDDDYYNIVLARVREITDPGAIGSYFLSYKRGFTWPNAVGESEFRRFFPFHKPALEVLRAITYELTTTRSAIHFMHQTLKQQMKAQGRDLIRLWELFDETVRYEEDPSGVHAGIVAVKTKREQDYRAYEVGRRQIEGMTKGALKVYRDRAVKALQTLFLYHIARIRQQGLNPEELANAVLIARDAEAPPDENIQHYESIAEALRKELRQVRQTFDEDRQPRYMFDPVFTGVDPRDEFRKARDEAEADEQARQEAWAALLTLDEWPVRTRQMTIDLANGSRSLFREIAPRGEQPLQVIWSGRQIEGLVCMRDLNRLAAESGQLPIVETDQDRDFVVVVAARPASPATVDQLLRQRNDQRVLVWVPEELTSEERGRLLDFTAYRKLVSAWQGKDTEDAVAVINWIANTLQTEIGKIVRIIDSSYGRGRVASLQQSNLDFHVAGEKLAPILEPLVDRVLTSCYESRQIAFDPPFVFRNEEAVKVINGIVKTGEIPRGAKPNQNISAAQNFGFGLNIIRRGAERTLDVSDNPFVQAIWQFIDNHLVDDRQPMNIETIYKNFRGLNGPAGKHYGLTRRIIQIYLVCLARQGRIRLAVSPRSGLSFSTIDYSNLAEIDFSARVLDSLTEIQKVTRPENWEVLQPYAERLLGQSLGAAQDDAAIAAYRARLRELFASGAAEAHRVADTAERLFATLGIAPIYVSDAQQVAALYQTDLADGNDIDRVLHALRETFGYQAFTNGRAERSEVDDLGNRLRDYQNLQRFLVYETELRTADRYVKHDLSGDRGTLRDIVLQQRAVADKLKNLQPLIDEEVRLRTELIGSTPLQPGERGTIRALIAGYTESYLALHDDVLNKIDDERRAILALVEGAEMRMLRALEDVSALQPAISGQLNEQLRALANELFNCPAASHDSVRRQLATGPVHECGLTFANAVEHLSAARAKRELAQRRWDEAIDLKLAVFFNTAVRERLEQGRNDQLIDGILVSTTTAELRAFLAQATVETPDFADRINRYLKRIVVKRVRLADFKPTMSTVESGQIAALAREFQQFLEDQLRSVEGDSDTLPVLQIE